MKPFAKNLGVNCPWSGGERI